MEIISINNQNVNQVQRINNYILGMKYSKKFYENSIGNGFVCMMKSMNRLIGIGALVYSIDGKSNSSSSSEEIEVYILSLAVEPAYRGYGIGTKLILKIKEIYKDKNTEKGKLEKIKICVHVYTENTSAIEWYKKRGFSIISRIPSYYNTFAPPRDAFYMTLIVSI